MQDILDKAKQWLNSTFDAETQTEIQELINNNPDDLADRFYKDMEFGTGGMRGVMGAGTNRINKYTLGRATQGLSNYLIENIKKEQLSVVIAYDCRHNSKKFSKIVADVLSANNIKVFLFEDLRATPELSFAVRHLNCDAGIVLTASHNPPEYNGYKVYWADGGQIVPPHDGGIIGKVNSLDFSEINFQANENLIEVIGKEVDAVFIEESVKNGSLSNKIDRKNLKIVFTSLHGTSIVSVPDALAKAGYSDVHIVEEQRVPNGDFPTVKSPNPEEPEALKMATDLANKIGADIVIGTDPDCDRLGVAVRDTDGNIKLMNGNQTMVVMTQFLLKKWKEEGKINGKQFIGSTIVSTELVNDLASSYNVETKVGLTGFKWIAKMVKDFPKLDFIGGGEESFGYMVGGFVRDKDAVTATLLACEIAAYAKQNGSSFYEELLNIYVHHKFYKEHLIAITKKGMDGAAEIQQMLSDMRNNPLTEIDGEKVESLSDYQASTRKNLITGDVTNINLPKSNVLIYQTESGTRIAARPSGTEPKIKFYFSVNTELDLAKNADGVEAELDAKIQRIIKEMKLN
ncbi:MULTISPECIES: phospho-sugar mutase [unclassified Polaribacter]|jgi:phosphomannomutase|uniref:phospho-sugar mutase n=1 Tax=unclassified Polaribacter TaxID=196858 RepID=UPI00052C33F2|nr:MULTISPECIES: phospho-sugar mutase [unclassified Polaribacter]KGL60590.1 phosphoglucomutase [Polaribacter sp. Hel1_33_49]PKV65112.1 phosphomannomutase [Polaribacter sp. Hel1_33_96]